MMKKDWSKIAHAKRGSQYHSRLVKLRDSGIDTSSIEHTVEAAIKSYHESDDSSFVIFGEPQSGKTEMMIALNARLLDERCDVIINLVTDSVDLLGQNLGRFREAGLSPSPITFTDLPDQAKAIVGRQWVVFCKKNSRDLEKLTDSIRKAERVVIVDDEADYASPNSKVNSDERTKINQQIHDLLEGRGRYIGVTATPARLDLNNTFENKAENWVRFEPHPNYVGQDFFFPDNGNYSYRLHTFSADEGDERKELIKAVLHFLCGVADQHAKGHEWNFTMLVHTSGKVDEHREDMKVVRSVMEVLSNPDADKKKFNRLMDQVFEIAKRYFSSNWSAEQIAEFVAQEAPKNQFVEINSKRSHKTQNLDNILKPKVLFSFGVGGNIISRGVTFENLLSMYFTRSVKGKFTQDTYVQRARMFGSRAAYKNDFQLWIPFSLMKAWQKCFVFHKLAIAAADTDAGAPVWLADNKTVPTSAPSIDRSAVDFEGGEMSFQIFDYDASRGLELFGKKHAPALDRLQHLREQLNENEFPTHVADYIEADLRNDKSVDIAFHAPSEFGRQGSYTNDEVLNIRRKKGIFATTEYGRVKNPSAKHHLKVYYNKHGCARLIYKQRDTKIQFIQRRS